MNDNIIKNTTGTAPEVLSPPTSAVAFSGSRDAMNAALLDDLRRQNLALKDALKCAANLLNRQMSIYDLHRLRNKWLLLIGEEE